jgi:hypothetical protein
LKEQILHLDPHDDFISARDKMGWVQTQRVLLVWPERGPRILSRRLDLLLLVRHARRLGARLALITRDPVIVEEAEALGLPVFPSLSASRGASWRSRLRLPQPPKRLPAKSGRPSLAKVKPAALPKKWPLWVRVLAGVAQVLVFAVGLAALVALAWALVPSATITLTPATHAFQTRIDIVADPQAANGGQTLTPTVAAGSPVVIPARTLRVEVEDTGRIATTGQREVPSSPASGTLIFTNLVGTRIVIPQGTGVRTTSGSSIRFVTNSAVTLEGKLGAIVEVGLTAEKPGPEGNVAPGQINAIDGPLGLQLAVTNPAPTQGGALTLRAAVAAADREQLRAQLREQLDAKARTVLATQLQPGEFLVTDTITVTQNVAETFNLPVGDQADTLELTLRLAVQGLAVSENAARAAGAAALMAQAPPNESLLPERSTFARSPALTVDGEGRIHFALTAAGATVAHLDRDSIRQAVRGQTIADTLLYLAAAQPLDESPRVDLWPGWYAERYPRLPWVPFRIQINVAAAH